MGARHNVLSVNEACEVFTHIEARNKTDTSDMLEMKYIRVRVFLPPYQRVG